MTAAGRGWRGGAGRRRLADIRVLMIGVEPPISRDVARALKAEQALVTAAAREAPILARLQRDLGLYRTTVEAADIDLSSASEMRLFALNLQEQGVLPHLLVCCCPGDDCPLPLAMSALQPSLILHVLPPPRTWLRRAARRLRAPSLAALLAGRRRAGLFDTKARPRRVRIAGHVFSLRRWEDTLPQPRGRPPEAGHAERRRRRGPTEQPAPYSSPQGRFHQVVS